MKPNLKLLPILMLLMSCSSSRYVKKPINEVLDTWIGSNEHELVVQIGPPASTTSDGNGGKILSYEESQYQTITFRPNNNSSSIYYGSSVSNTSSLIYYIQYYVDATSKIYHWRTNVPYALVLDTMKRKPHDPLHLFDGNTKKPQNKK